MSIRVSRAPQLGLSRLRHRGRTRAIKPLAAKRRREDSARNNSQRTGEERPMDFTMSDRQKEWLGRVQSFMTKHVRPAVPIYKQQDAEGARWKVIPILEELKKKAHAEGLWNMFMRPSSHEDDGFRAPGWGNRTYTR